VTAAVAVDVAADVTAAVAVDVAADVAADFHKLQPHSSSSSIIRPIGILDPCGI
jgi:hypothetical protein